VHHAQELKKLLDIGRLDADNVDFRPFTTKDTVELAHVNNGLRMRYYRAPAYGDNADPQLARFVPHIRHG